MATNSMPAVCEHVVTMICNLLQSTGYPGTEDDVASLQGTLGGGLVQLTPEVIKEMGSDQIYKVYQMYVKELSVRLIEVNRTPAAETQHMQELESLVKDLVRDSKTKWHQREHAFRDQQRITLHVLAMH